MSIEGMFSKSGVADVARLREVEFRNNVECPKSCDIGYFDFQPFKPKSPARFAKKFIHKILITPRS